MDSSALTVAHLMRRAGFSASADELNQRVQRGLDATITDLVYYENTPDTTTIAVPHNSTPANLPLASIQAYWLQRMVQSPRPLQEKMSLFWHNHFATGNFKVKNPTLMLRQNQFFRDYALADFRAVLQGISRDPAMLVWLDNVGNNKGHANENYAREVMELFTMGRGNYTEQDVQNSARAFTGWGLRGDQFWINIKDHDFSTKTVLGVTGRLNGDDVIDILVRQPATARFMATKLLKFFATDKPDGAWTYRIAQVFSQSDGDIRATVEAIFRSEEFYSPAIMNQQYKSPTEYVVNAMKETQVMPNLRTVADYVSQMGQNLFNPPSVKGWDGGESWINTATMLARINFAGFLVADRVGSLSPTRLYQDLVDARLSAADEVVDLHLNRMGNVSLTPETNAAVMSYLNSSSSGVYGPFTLTKKSADVKVRNVVRLILSSPEYQFN